VPLELVIGFSVAMCCAARSRARGAAVLLLLPWLVSPIASGVMWHFLFGGATGIVDFVLGWLGRPDVPRPGRHSSCAAAVIAVEVCGWPVRHVPAAAEPGFDPTSDGRRRP